MTPNPVAILYMIILAKRNGMHYETGNVRCSLVGGGSQNQSNIIIKK